MKPIQGTPELSGADAIKLLKQVNTKPTQEAIAHNKKLQSILKQILK